MGLTGLGLCELQQHKPWCEEVFLHFYSKGNRPNCSGYRIQTKAI